MRNSARDPLRSPESAVDHDDRSQTWGLGIRTIAIGVVTAVIALGLAACGGGDGDASTAEAQGGEQSSETGAATGSGDVVRFNHVFSAPEGSPAFANFWIGEELGFFAEEGVSNEEQFAQGGTAQAIQLTIAGEVDITTPAPETLFAAVVEGNDPGLVFVCNATYKTILEVVAPEDSDIKTHADLEGKTIGVPALGAHPSLLHAQQVAEEAGVPLDSITFVNVGLGPSAAQALNSGQVDALSLWDSQYVQLEALGAIEPLRHLGQSPITEQLFGSADAVPRETLEDPERRQALIGWLRGVIKATIFMYANPEAAVRLHWKMFPQTKPTGVPEEQALEAALKEIEAKREKWLPPEGAKWCEFDEAQIGAFEEYLGAPEGVEFDGLITNELVDEVNAGIDTATIEEMARNFDISSLD